MAKLLQRHTFKRIGAYLVEAGLVTPAQLDVALTDQQVMGNMRLGEVLVARGWVKQQTLDYLFEKIIAPEQRAARQAEQEELEASVLVRAAPQTSAPARQPTPAPNPQPKNKINDRKPLPALLLEEDLGVNWVG
jgi:hypothetical protein